MAKGRMVAVKKIENVFDHRSLAKRTLRELQLCRALQHENILGLDRVVRPHSHGFSNVYLISELMETDLACVIRSPQELTEEHVQFFIYQVLRGLKYMHTANVIHRCVSQNNMGTQAHRGNASHCPSLRLHAHIHTKASLPNNSCLRSHVS
jgi:serine/threonine protein kinase